MWYIYRMEYYSDIERNDLDTVIQHEVIEKEKMKYHLVTTVESRQMIQMNLFVKQK